MENRIDRSADESLYQLKIHSERIRSLYQLKQQTGKPMTVLLDQAIRELADTYESEFSPEGREETVFENMEQETWEEVCEYKELLDRLDYLKCLAEMEKIKNDNRG